MDKPKPVISVATMKGGTGKTTTSVHLADWLIRQGQSVTFINTAPQLGVNRWLEGIDSVSTVEIYSFDRLYQAVENADTSYVIVDIAGDRLAVMEMLGICDYILMPLKCSVLDMTDTNNMIELLERPKNKNIKYGAFINFADQRRSGLKLTQEYFRMHKLKLLETYIRNLSIIERCPATKNTVFGLQGKESAIAAKDYTNLFEEFFEESLLSHV